MDVIDKITAMIAPSLEAMGYEIVQIKLEGGAKRKTLILMAERKDQRMMGFDDCTDISRTVSALMDVEDPIAGAYNLEVCSPGIDRPLIRLEDYQRYQGFEVKLETLIPVNGRKRYKGIIAKREDEDIILTTDQGEVTLPFANIRGCKLVMTDELVKRFMKEQKN